MGTHWATQSESPGLEPDAPWRGSPARLPCGVVLAVLLALAAPGSEEALAGTALHHAVARASDVELAALGDYRVTDEAKVYHGNSRLFQRPAQIRSSEVYDQIPEYQEIVKKGLTDKDPRYHFLLRRASERFSEAVKAMARDASFDHDLVAESGAVTRSRKEAAEIPDRTSAVIAKLN